MTPLEIAFEETSDAVVVRVVGEIDITNLGYFSEELQRAGAVPVGLVAVDLAGVKYLDSAGIRTLFELARTLEMGRREMAIVVPATSPLRRLFTITEIGTVVRIVASVDEAITRGASPT